MRSSASLRDEMVTWPTLVGENIATTAQHNPVSPFGASKDGLRLKLYAGLILIDVLALFLAFMLANLVRYGEFLNRTGIEILFVLLPIYLGMAWSCGAVSIDVLMKPRLGLERSVRSLVFAVAIVTGIFFYLKTGADFSRFVMGFGPLVAAIAMVSARWIFGQVVGRRYRWRFINKLVFIDNSEFVPSDGQVVLYADRAQLVPTISDPLQLDRLGRLLKHCDRVVLACVPERRAAWAAMMKGSGVNVEILTPELDSMGALSMNRFEGRSTVLVSHAPLGLRDRITKRAFDLAVAILALIVATPILAAAAIAIKLDTQGPIFFRQKRMGRGNRIFHVLKFRTMRVEATDHFGKRSTDRDDDRVTRVGAFLRRTSIDELPQLLNVLAGSMSIVGPRPHALASTAEDLLFWHIDPRYWERHVIQPGITGLAQVRGLRGATFRQSDLRNRLQADLEYVTNWSIWRDIGIVAATAKVMIHRNAY